MAINVVEILVKAKDMTAAGFGEAEAQTASFGSRVKAVGAVAAGALAVIGYESAKMAINFDSAMEQLVTQAGVSNAKLAVLKQGVLQLASQVGESPDSLAASLYHVASNMQSMGATSQQMLGAVKVAAEGAKVGGADLVDVTNALTAAIASGMKGTKNFSQAMGVLNATVGTGDMKMQDLADAFGTGMLAAVKGFGLSITDVGAALATFGDNNIRGAKAGTDLRMAVMGLAAPAKTGASALAAMGLSAGTLARDMQKGGLQKAVNDLRDHLQQAGLTGKRAGEVLTEAFGKKAGVGLNILVDEIGRFNSKYPDLVKGAHSFGTAWEQTKAQVKQQLSQLGAGFQALMITIGEKLLPVVQSLVSWMLQHKTVTLAVLGAVTALAAGLATLAIAVKAVEIVTAAWEVVQGILDAELLANPVGVVIAVLVGLGIAIYELVKHWHTLVHAFDVGRHEIAHIFDNIRHDIAHVFDDIRHDIAARIDGILHDVEARFDQIRHAIAAKFDQIRHDIATWGDDVLNWFKGLPGRIVQALGNLGHLLYNAGMALMMGFLHGIEHGYDNARHFVAHIADDIASLKGPLPKDAVLLYPHGRAIMGGLLNGLQSRMADLNTQMARTTSAITGGVPRGGYGTGYGGAGTAAPLRLQLEWAGGHADGEFMTWLARNIRIRGGDPRVLTQKVGTL